MIIRYIGAGLTILSGGIYAVFATKAHRDQIRYYEELLLILEHFVWELQTNLSPLGVCCSAASRCGKGEMKLLFFELSQRLDSATETDPAACMALAMAGRELPLQLRQRLSQLADSLGRYDLSGQIAAVTSMMELCKRDLNSLISDGAKALHSCRTLGLCTGAALAILLL